MSTNTEALLKEYDACAGVSQDIVDYLADFLERICKDSKIHVHAINGRVKERSSFVSKIGRPEKTYQSISEVYDLVGVRVITYFKEDVDKVALLVEKEFDVDKERSTDKRRSTDPDRFGYSSLHYVVKLKRSRLRLTEFKRFSGCVAEIQIRSIIQHAWAEIEHDLGYKSTVAVPSTIKRKFSRLAALLELADEEFAGVAHEVSAYERSVTRRLKNEHRVNGVEITVDATSLQVFVMTNSLVAEVDAEIALNAKGSLETRADAGSRNAVRFTDVGLKSLFEIEGALKRHRRLIVAWANDWLGEMPQIQLGRGISLFYLLYVILAEIGDEERLVQHLKMVRLGAEKEGGAASLAKRVMETYRRLRS